ncbi:MAG: ATP-binding protein [Betaproteobacteria bacterium]
MSRVETTIANTLAGVARAGDLVAEVARAHDLPREVASHMCVALDEVLSNIVKYGYTDDAVHQISLALSVADGMLIAEVEDDARPFDPLSVPAPNLDVPLEERRVGGLGVHFVRKLMSEVAYCRVGGRNRLVIKKRVESGKEGTQ